MFKKEVKRETGERQKGKKKIGIVGKKEKLKAKKKTLNNIFQTV